MSKQGRNIAIIGGGGNIGRPTLSSLVSQNIHTITAITRTSSTAEFPQGVQVKRGDYGDESFLVSALQGNQVLILQLGIEGMPLQETFVRAAAKAGVRYVLPAEFGSDPDPDNKLWQKLSHILGGKKALRELIEQLGLRWIGVISNPWIDYVLPLDGFWGLDLAKKQVTIYDGGNVKYVMSTLADIGKGTAELVSLPEGELEEHANKPVFFRSFHITQRELFDSALRVTDTQEGDWTVVELDSDQDIERSEKGLATGDQASFFRLFVATHQKEGWGGDFEGKVDKGLIERFGVGRASLDDVVGGVWEAVQKKA